MPHAAFNVNDSARVLEDALKMIIAIENGLWRVSPRPVDDLESQHGKTLSKAMVWVLLLCNHVMCWNLLEGWPSCGYSKHTEDTVASDNRMLASMVIVNPP